MRQSDGFILLLVLLFMQIFSMLGLMELGNLAVSIKSQSMFLKRNALEQKAILFYKSVQHYDWSIASCFVQPFSIETLRQASFNWWQENGCSYDPNSFFIIEKSQADPCSYLSKSTNNHAFTVQYYRVTLALFSENHFAILQQSTYAEPAPTVSICQDDTKHIVSLGRQMVRDV